MHLTALFKEPVCNLICAQLHEVFVEVNVLKNVGSHMQDSEAASCKMNSLGSNHSIPSTSVSTGSQSSSVNSMQEVLDDSCSDMTMMHPQDYSSTLDSSPHTKKVKVKCKAGMVGGRWWVFRVRWQITRTTPNQSQKLKTSVCNFQFFPRSFVLDV